jgi:hypothetical protein
MVRSAGRAKGRRIGGESRDPRFFDWTIAMESFVDAHFHTRLTKIKIKEGESFVVALRKPKDAGGRSLTVNTGDWGVASTHQSFHLKDLTKKKYVTSGNEAPMMSKMFDDFVPVESHGFVYFQVSGRDPGSTTLFADLSSEVDAERYVEPIDVEVVENIKHLFFGTTAGAPPVTFDRLWSNHPIVQNGGRALPDDQKLCNAHLAGACMLNFATALERSGVDFAGMRGTKCGLRGHTHQHHFVNPYDFELWKRYAPSHYEWVSKAPLQREPMPGLAAFDFMIGRQGIVLFWNYWGGHGVAGMFGGHIDLWNKDVMGNSLAFANHTDGESAFFRARKISFWPMDEHKRRR